MRLKMVQIIFIGKLVTMEINYICILMRFLNYEL